MDASENLIRTGLNTLINYGEVSTDSLELNNHIKRVISLYRDIRTKAKGDTAYAALAILPFIITQTEGRPISLIEKYTQLDRETIVKGVDVLIKEGLIRATQNYETLYGDTPFANQLFNSIKDTYRKTRST
jgi:hypothetical protein